MTESQQLVKLWATLEQMKVDIDNVAVPLGVHLGLEDPDLMVALEDLSNRIAAHFQRFKLVAIARNTEQG